MRFGLILAVLIAVVAVIFALQNAGTTALHLGAYTVTVLTPVLLIVTFGIGAAVGMLLAVPSAIRRGRRIKVLERELRDARPAAAYTTSDRVVATDPALTGVPHRETRL